MRPVQSSGLSSSYLDLQSTLDDSAHTLSFGIKALFWRTLEVQVVFFGGRPVSGDMLLRSRECQAGLIGPVRCQASGIPALH